MNSHQSEALSRFAEGQYQVDPVAVADAMLRRCLWIQNPTADAGAKSSQSPRQSSVVVLRRAERGHVAPPQSAAA
jgi:hypothetical protein